VLNGSILSLRLLDCGSPGVVKVSDGLVAKLRLKPPNKMEPRQARRIFVTRRPRSCRKL